MNSNVYCEFKIQKTDSTGTGCKSKDRMHLGRDLEESDSPSWKYPVKISMVIGKKKKISVQSQRENDKYSYQYQPTVWFIEHGMLTECLEMMMVSVTFHQM